MKYDQLIFTTGLSFVLSFIIWLVLSWAFDLCYPGQATTLEPLLSTIFVVMLGLITAVSSLFLETEKTEALSSVLFTIILMLLTTRALSTIRLDIINILLNFILYLPLALTSFFATWTYFKK